MRNYPKVSIIIPTKNEEQNIVRCLKSIKKQRYAGKIEIIVVDNFSTDRTIILVKPYCNRVLLVAPERSKQRNMGAKVAHGKYLLFLDADMQLGPEVISECIEIINSTDIPTVLAIKEQPVGRNFWGRALALERSCYSNILWLAGARFFAKKTFLEIGGYDERLIAAEDWDITQRFIKKGYQLLLTKTTVFHHEPDTGFLNMLKKEIYYIKNIKNYERKHPKAFALQSGLVYRSLLYLKAWDKLLPHPILTFAFLWYKFSVWILWNIEHFNENR